MQESKKVLRKHVTMDVQYHMALKIYSAKVQKTSKEIIKEALDKMPGFKECLQ